jgi:hypothetical protein
MTLTYTFDQRVIDEAPAARFLEDIKRLMEGELQEHLGQPKGNLREPKKFQHTANRDLAAV